MVCKNGLRPGFGICKWIAEHVVEEGGDEVGGAAVGLGAQLPQLIRFVQQLH